VCPNYLNKPDGTVCNDGNECTQTDLCKAGVCVGSGSCVCGDGLLQTTVGEQW
jgi:hypothetical protein